MRNSNTQIEDYKSDLKSSFKHRLNFVSLGSAIITMTINDFLLLLSTLDDSGEYSLCTDGTLYFKDCRGYHGNEMTLVDLMIKIDVTKTHISSLSSEEIEELERLLANLIDTYNLSYNHPDNKHRKIIYKL